MKLKDELRLRIQHKIRDKFQDLENQKKLAKDYYILFRDQIVDIAIEAFVEYQNGVEIPKERKVPVPGPNGKYNDDAFLKELIKMLEDGVKASVIAARLGVSDSTVSRGKSILIQRGLV